MKSEFITVARLKESLPGKIELVNFPSEKAFERKILYPDLQFSGLALAGSPELVERGKIQVFSENELKYIEKLTVQERKKRLNEFFKRDFPCLVVSEPSPLLKEISKEAEQHDKAIFLCKTPKYQCLREINRILIRFLSEKLVIHGVLVNINGIGVLIIGESGIGKSEVALDLISRGHVFVADDVVEVYKDAAGYLIGRAPERTRGFMEVRGLGIIKVEEVFGAGSVMPEKRIDIAFELCKLEEDFDRLYIKQYSLELLGGSVPLKKIPVAPGRNIANIIEVATKLFTLERQGKSPLKEFLNRIGEEDEQT